jgi:hypothetical protein
VRCYFLLFEKLQLNYDVLGCDRRTSKFFKQIFSIEEAECIVRTTVVQLLSFIGIYVIHHQEHILLCQVIKAVTLRQNASYQLMIDFTRSLLIELARITIKHLGSVVWNLVSGLNGFRI